MATNPTAGIAYADSERARKAYLERLARVEAIAAARMRQEYAVAMRRVEERLISALERAGTLIGQGANPLAAMTQATLLDQQRQFIQSEMLRFGESAATPFVGSVNAANALGITHAMQQLSGITADVFRPNAQTIMQMAARTAPGTALREHVYRLGDRVGEQVTTDLLTGAMLGDNPRAVATRIRSTLDSVVPHLNTLVRTETLGAARQGQLDTYAANGDVVTGWIWDAAQDRRTCAVCWAMNGSEHEIREPFASHPNCRCTPLPRLKSYDEILGTTGKFVDDGPKAFSGDATFRKQPASVQLGVLGPSKYAAYVSGNLPTIARLVGPTHHRVWGPGLRERTLGELDLPRVTTKQLGETVSNAKRLAALHAELLAAQAIVDAAKAAASTSVRDVSTSVKLKLPAELTERAREVLKAIDAVHGIPADASWMHLKLGRNAQIPVVSRSVSSYVGQFTNYTNRISGERYPGTISMCVPRAHRTGTYSWDATFTHEYGHFVDEFVMLPNSSSVFTESAAFDPIRKAVHESATYANILKMPRGNYRTYLTSDTEVFARAYYQWIAIRSRNPTLLRELDTELGKVDAAELTEVWTAEDFAPIADAFDKAFNDRGMLR